MKPNWTHNHKTKEDAIQHILSCLVENTAVANDEGTLRMFVFGKWVELRPIKKKK